VYVIPLNTGGRGIPTPINTEALNTESLQSYSLQPPCCCSPFLHCLSPTLYQENGASFEGSMLKLLRTLPKVLKYLPSDKAAVSCPNLPSPSRLPRLSLLFLHLQVLRGSSPTLLSKGLVFAA
jgi:hypothetical protein